MTKKQGPVEKALRRARRLVDGGWTRGKFSVKRDGKTCYCALGAISVGGGAPCARFPLPGEVSDRAWEVMAECSDFKFKAMLSRWNDAQKSKRPVLTAFDRAIALAKERGL